KECAASAPGSSTDSATLSLGDRQGGVADGAARTGVQAEDARAHGKPTWAYRYRVDGRGSARPQVGGFATQGEALQALQVALERLQRRNGRFARITLSELAEEYLAQHEAEPRTIAKLRWLLAKATAAFGECRVVD